MLRNSGFFINVAVLVVICCESRNVAVLVVKCCSQKGNLDCGQIEDCSPKN